MQSKGRKNKADYSEKDPEFLRAAGLRRIAQKEYSSEELVRYFVLRGVERPQAVSVVEKLAEKGWIDDHRTMRSLVVSGLIQGKGTVVIRQKLKQKGIRFNESELGLLMDELREERGLLSEAETIDKLIQRRYRGKLEDRKVFQKAYQWLVRRGFHSRLILDCLKKSSKSISSDEDPLQHVEY